MKLTIELEPWLEIGWFKGENSKLLNICIMEIITDYKTNHINLVTILQIQVLKFTFGFGLTAYC